MGWCWNGAPVRASKHKAGSFLLYLLWIFRLLLTSWTNKSKLDRWSIKGILTQYRASVYVCLSKRNSEQADLISWNCQGNSCGLQEKIGWVPLAIPLPVSITGMKNGQKWKIGGWDAQHQPNYIIHCKTGLLFYVIKSLFPAIVTMWYHSNSWFTLGLSGWSLCYFYIVIMLLHMRVFSLKEFLGHLAHPSLWVW